jgi:hypothetical protein
MRPVTPERVNPFAINRFSATGIGACGHGPALAMSAREKGSDLWRIE